MRRLGTAATVLMIALIGCSGDDADAPDVADAAEVTSTSLADVSPDAQFPDIVGAEASFDDGTETWSFAVTVSSPYDTPERYADGWRVVGPHGEVYGVHTLAHDHANEQPFTRRQTGVEIPSDVDQVTIEGRDQANGFGGQTFTVDLGVTDR